MPGRSNHHHHHFHHLCPGSPVVCILWLAAWVGFTTLGLLTIQPTLQFFQSRNMYTDGSPPTRFSQKQGDLDHSRLSWTQENVSQHFSRATKEDVTSKPNLKLWRPPPNRGLVPCVEPSKKYKAGKGSSRGYLLVQSNGGLNQMRTGICDMVAVARILNATLVIPELDKRSYWADFSKFSDIFNEDYFIEALKNDVDVVRKLPKDVAMLPKARKQFRSWSNVKYYEDDIAPLFDEYKVIRAAKSDSRLANNGLPADIQKLRCRVHYDALRFAPRIEALGQSIVERMRVEGPYIALHLRYEQDMLAFSGCTHGLTEEEAGELAMIRENTAHWKEKVINSTEKRAKGLCPLTPKEVGIFLKGLGYPSSTRIYLAAGGTYGGDERLKDLQDRFPHLMRKDAVATAAELAPFLNHSSQLAALDYIVSVEADVFVPSHTGNMAVAVEGHRRYLGHRKSILPDRKALVDLFNKIELGEMREDEELSAKIIDLHKRRQGGPRKRKGPTTGSKGKDRFRTEEAFYVNPFPDCLCSTNDTSMLQKGVV